MMSADRPRVVLNITKHDAIGRRFNNLEAAPTIARHGWESRFCVWSEPKSGQHGVVQAKSGLGRLWSRYAPMVDIATGSLDRYYRNARSVMNVDDYRVADLLHYHIVHERWLSAADWRRLARGKPVVWTWHDPYFLTGHCIYPMDCRGFETGCARCPHLNYHFPIRRDRARQNLNRKRRAVFAIDPLVVVASQYMAGLVRRSVYGNQLRLRVVPFGVHWPALPSRGAVRRALGIPEGNVVIGFRAVYSDYKGLPLIQEALTKIASVYRHAPITIIALQEIGTLREIDANWQILEPGWIMDSRIGDYYSAMDLFLMPSRAEAFGMMAIEALAAGALPIVTYGTALPELIAAPIHGIAVEHSAEALKQAILDAIRQAPYWKTSAPERRAFAQARYSMDTFGASMAEVYDEQYAYYVDHGRAPR